jgi:hypothetical protein
MCPSKWSLTYLLNIISELENGNYLNPIGFFQGKNQNPVFNVLPQPVLAHRMYN